MPSHFSHSILALTLTISLLGCSKESSDSAVTLTPKGNADIVLHQGIDGWKVTVSDVDETERVGFLGGSTLNVGDTHLRFETINAALPGLPRKFTLQNTPTGTFQCVECEPSMSEWTRKGS